MPISSPPLSNPNLHSNLLPVMEHFYTLQGEGFHQGKAAYFVRLAGCNVGCVWCDVKESWQINAAQKITISEILNHIQNSKTQIAVITGGEPLLHHLDDLTAAMRNAGIAAHIETSGSSPLSGSWDWICLSPKKFKPPLSEIIPFANELKIIVFNKNDFEWAEEYAHKVSSHCKLYLQPEWGKAEEMLPSIIEYIKNNPKWELSLQLHKYINVP
jgi:7-carboxy-7-deazaguanine synthase